MIGDISDRYVSVYRFYGGSESISYLEKITEFVPTTVRWTENVNEADSFSVSFSVSASAAKIVREFDWIYIPSDDGIERVGHILKREVSGSGGSTPQIILSGKSFYGMFSRRLCQYNVDTDWLPDGVGLSTSYTAGDSTAFRTTRPNGFVVPGVPWNVKLTYGSMETVVTYTYCDVLNASTLEFYGLKVVSGSGNTFPTGTSIVFASSGHDVQTDDINDLIWHYLVRNSGYNPSTGLPSGEWGIWVPLLSLTKPQTPNDVEWPVVTATGRYQTIHDMIRSLMAQIPAVYGVPKITFHPQWSDNKTRITGFIMGYEPTAMSPTVCFSSAEGAAMPSSIDFSTDLSAEKNWIRALGPGTGAGRMKTLNTVNSQIGFASSASVLNASDVVEGDATSLQLRADQYAADNVAVKSATVVPYVKGIYQYPRDYKIGDVVTIHIGETDERYDLRITSITETIDGSSGNKLSITCGNPPNMLDRLIQNDILRTAAGELRK